jgi:hypothetical protein
MDVGNWVGEGPPDTLSLTRGGPLFKVQTRLHLQPRGRDTVGVRFPLAVIGLAWLPVMLLALPERFRTGTWDPMLLRSEVHVRLLCCLYLFLLGEGLLESRVRSVTRRILDCQILTEANLPLWRAAIARVLQRRDALLPELMILGAVYAVSFAAFLGVLPPGFLRWLAPTIHETGPHWNQATAAGWWYLLVSQPLFLFVFGRWLWRWLLWSTLLWRLAKLQPRADPGHADCAAGFGFLSEPLFAMRLFAFGSAFALTSVWVDEIALNKAKPAIFANDLVLIVVASLLIGLLPYLTFTRTLVEAKHEGVLAYSLLMRHYTERFDHRWLNKSPSAGQILGNEDFSGLADLGTSFSVVNDMRSLVPSNDEIKAHLLATLVPFLAIPLLFSASTADVIERVMLNLLGAD